MGKSAIQNLVRSIPLRLPYHLVFRAGGIVVFDNSLNIGYIALSGIAEDGVLERRHSVTVFCHLLNRAEA